MLGAGEGPIRHQGRSTSISFAALTLSLKSRGIAVIETSAPKQTETTQRWKVGLSVEGRSLALHTKIEFSRRAASEEAKVEAVGAGVLADYGFMPLLAPHYPLAPALRQKVLALVGRAAVQARDVFDLSVLSAKAGGDAAALRPVAARMEQAIDKTLEVSYDAYRSQVVSYLKPEHIDSLGSPEAWDALQSQVIAMLERARR